jgi:hypothetical protein
MLMRLIYIRHKLDYNSWPMTFLGGLHAAGILIQPYDLFLEGLHKGPIPAYETPPEGFRIENLELADMKRIAAMPDHNIPQFELIERLERKNECLGVFLGSELVSFTWCNLVNCTYPGDRFSLSPHEAYLFDAYTSRAHRGKDLAPLVRYQIYKKLERTGRNRFYSVSERLNKPAARFKQKLNAQVLRSGIYVELFRRWRYTKHLPKRA